MNLISYQEEYSTTKSFNEKPEENDDTGTGRYYECIFCKRGFTTAQALGGHMNIHRKDKANKSKLPRVHDNNYGDLGFYSEVSNHTQGGNYSYYSTVPEVDSNNYHQVYFPATRPSHVEINQQDWRQRNLSLYDNPFSALGIKEKFEEDGLDLELRLGRHP